MTPEEIPQSLVDILDARAGKKHSRTGPVLACLAEILTAHAALMVGSVEPHIRHDLIRETNRVSCDGCSLDVERPEGVPNLGRAWSSWR